MTTVEYSQLIDNIDVISQDAYRVGLIEGVRYDPHDYSIYGIIVKCGKEISNMIGAGSSKARVLIKPDSFEVNDVFLLGDTLEDAKSYIQPDNEAMSSVANLERKPVTTYDNQKLGEVVAVLLDLNGWYVQSFVIKLEKEAHAALGIKKGMISCKKIEGITTEHISTVSENIILTLTMDEVKNVMQVQE